MGPAGIPGTNVEVVVPIAEGVEVRRIKTSKFPFARTMSQERTILAAGKSRPMVWTSADALLVVVEGAVNVGLEGGLLMQESHVAFKDASHPLEKGDIAYLPNGRAYWLQEATGRMRAMTITVFNVGEWKSFEASASTALMPDFAVMSNLHQKSNVSVLY